MPRSIDDLIAQADELEGYEPRDANRGEPSLMALRRTAYRRALIERGVVERVRAAREAGASWAKVGKELGTSGEAARQRYTDRIGASSSASHLRTAGLFVASRKPPQLEDWATARASGDGARAQLEGGRDDQAGGPLVAFVPQVNTFEPQRLASSCAVQMHTGASQQRAALGCGGAQQDRMRMSFPWGGRPGPLVRAVIAGAVFALFACDAAPPRPDRPEMEPEPPSPREVSGIIVGDRDDVAEGEEPTYVIPGRSVLIVPSAAEPDLWAGEQHAGPTAPPEDDNLDRGGRFDPELLDRIGAVLAPGGDDGRFEAEVEAGRYLVCLHRDDDVPVVIAGCARTELTPGDSIVVSRGEFGTRVR